MKAMKEIAGVLATMSDEAAILRFLESILTPNEIREISSRWELVKMLESGASQRAIAKKLGLSLCKITRGSRELKKSHSPFAQAIDLFKQKQEKNAS